MNELLQPCKGFWNMCPCSVCRARDRELSKASKEERDKARAEFIAHCRDRNQNTKWE